MNNKVKSEKYRKLPIAAFVIGIFAFAFVVFLMVLIAPFVGGYLDNFIPEGFVPFFILSCYVICFPIPAIICGSIDLTRIKSGRYSNKGKDMDIAGIVLGSVFILLVILFIFFEYYSS
jgi:hypothetical protein